MLARLLSSLCSLLLALPQGWCCWPVCCSEGPAGKLEIQAPTPKACCCCAAARASDSGNCEICPDGEAPRPPFKPSSCPCCVVNALKFVPTGVGPDLQLALLAAPVLVDVPLVQMAGGTFTLASAHAADPPLFLLHCIWRC